jgi:hypothetical protein
MVRTEIPRDKIEAYLETHYRVGISPDVLVLRIGQHSPELASRYEQDSCDCALFITAFNPFGRKQDDADNQVAHAHLGEKLRGVADHLIEGDGADPTGQWPAERSYLAFGIDADAAQELGRHFKQDAVVWIGRDAVPQLLLLR